MHVDDPVHGVDIGKLDVVEEAAAQNASQFLLVVDVIITIGRRLALISRRSRRRRIPSIEFEQEIVGNSISALSISSIKRPGACHG